MSEDETWKKDAASYLKILRQCAENDESPTEWLTDNDIIWIDQLIFEVSSELKERKLKDAKDAFAKYLSKERRN